MKRIVLVGAGPAHLAALKAIAKAPLPNARLALVSRAEQELHPAMLPGVVAGHYRLKDVQIDVAAVAKRAGAHFIPARVVGCAPEQHGLTLEGGDEIEYDLASFDVGARIDLSLPGAEAHALAVKPFEGFVRSFGFARHVAIAGGGVAGAELAMALRKAGAQVTLFAERPAAPAFADARLVRALRRMGVDYRPGMAVSAIEAGPVVVSGPTRQAFDRVLLASPAAHPWLAGSGLATDERGFVRVHDTLQSQSHGEVFAAGECAALDEHFLPRTGAHAQRQGERLARNLRNLLAGQPLQGFGATPRALSLVSCGRRHAIATWGEWAAEGRWVWWWKNALDRRWVRSCNAG